MKIKTLVGLIAAVVIIVTVLSGCVEEETSVPTVTPTPEAPITEHKFNEGDILIAPWSYSFAKKEMYPHDTMLEAQILLVKENTYTLAYPSYIKDNRLTELDIESIDEHCVKFDDTREDLRKLINEYNEDYCAKYEPSYYMSETEIGELINFYAIRAKGLQ